MVMAPRPTLMRIDVVSVYKQAEGLGESATRPTGRPMRGGPRRQALGGWESEGLAESYPYESRENGGVLFTRPEKVFLGEGARLVESLVQVDCAEEGFDRFGHNGIVFISFLICNNYQIGKIRQLFPDPICQI